MFTSVSRRWDFGPNYGPKVIHFPSSQIRGSQRLGIPRTKSRVYFCCPVMSSCFHYVIKTFSVLSFLALMAPQRLQRPRTKSYVHLATPRMTGSRRAQNIRSSHTPLSIMCPSERSLLSGGPFAPPAPPRPAPLLLLRAWGLPLLPC